MKLDQDEKRTPLESDNGVAASRARSRRNFLQKSSAAVVITSLAAQPVWGRCTVSGAMSGGSATHGEDEDPCTLPNVQGQPPTFWADLNLAMLANAFEFFRDAADAETLRCFIAEVRTEGFFILPATPTSREEIVNIDEALAAPWGNRSQLASIWLNAYFGFFAGGMLPGRDPSSPQEWVEHFFSLSLDPDWGESAFDVLQGHATTQWSNLPYDYTCA